MLAGGLFLFATSVPSSLMTRTRTDKLLQLAQEALRSDPTVIMEMGSGVEAGNVYASSNDSFWKQCISTCTSVLDQRW